MVNIAAGGGARNLGVGANFHRGNNAAVFVGHGFNGINAQFIGGGYGGFGSNAAFFGHRNASAFVGNPFYGSFAPQAILLGQASYGIPVQAQAQLLLVPRAVMCP